MISKIPRKLFAGAVAPLVLGLLTACAGLLPPIGHQVPDLPLLTPAAGEPVVSEASPAAGTPYGSYLAGHFAGRQRDLSAAADYMLQALAHDPENPQLLGLVLTLVAGNGRHEEAVDLARRLNEINRGNGLAALVLAIDEIDREAYQESDSLLSSLPTRGLSMVVGPLLRGWVRVAEGDLAGAMKRVGVLKNKGAFDVLYRLHTALMRDVAGQVEEAADEYEKALVAARQPSLRLVWLAGNFFERAARPTRAVKLYQTFLEHSPRSTVIATALDRARRGDVAVPLVGDAKAGAAEALFGLAGLLTQERGEALSLAYLHLALRLHPDFALAQVLLGEVLQAQGRGAEAIAVYQGVPIDSPFSWMVRLRVAEEFVRLDRTKEAEAELESLALAQPESYEPLLRLGNIMRNEERFEDAVQAYDRAVARVGTPERRHWRLFYFRGIALERLSRWPPAERDFLLALDLEPEQPFVMNYLAYSWVEKKLHLDQAKGMLVRAVELRPEDGFIVDSLGWVYFRLGEYEDGVKYLERAVELRPQDPVINDHLGDAYWRVGRKLEAGIQWRRTLSLDPEDETIAEIEAKIERGLVTRRDSI